MNEIRLVVENLKYALPILTVISIARMVLFYSFFNIRIGEYLPIQEFFSPFIADILFYIVFSFVPTIILIVFFGEKIGPYNTEIFNEQKVNTFWARTKNDLKRGWPVMILIAVSLGFFIYKKHPFEQIMHYVLMVPALYLFFWLRREFLIKTKIQLNGGKAAYINIVSIIALGSIVLMANTFSRISIIKTGYIPVVLTTTEKETIFCGDSLSYIGRTHDFTFLYDKKKDATTVISNDRVESVVF